MAAISKSIVIKALRAAMQRANSSSTPSNYAQGKAYELKVLTHIINKMRSEHGFTISCIPKNKNYLTFGGSPCKPGSSHHDFITANRGKEHYELWISVEFTTFSHRLGGSISPADFSDKHEIDIGLYQAPLGSSYPSYKEVIFAVSCKAGTWHKAQVREAIGLRMELDDPNLPRIYHDLAPLLAPHYPPYISPRLALFSGDHNSIKYQRSLSSLGLYIKHFT